MRFLIALLKLRNQFLIFKPTFPTRFHNIKSEAEEHPNEEITEEMENQTDWELQVDCISIIRLRACDVENMIISNDDEDMLTNQTQQSNQTGNESITEHSGTEGTSSIKKQSTTTPKRKGKIKKCQNPNVRLVFRISVPEYCPREREIKTRVLQVTSQKINCAQPQGVPDISKMNAPTTFTPPSTTVQSPGEIQSFSAVHMSALDDENPQEIWIRGKNFNKQVKVRFREFSSNGQECWSKTAQLDNDQTDRCLLIAYIPRYDRFPIQKIHHPVKCEVVVCQENRESSSQTFYYLPDSTVNPIQKPQARLTNAQNYQGYHYPNQPHNQGPPNPGPFNPVPSLTGLFLMASLE